MKSTARKIAQVPFLLVMVIQFINTIGRQDSSVFLIGLILLSFFYSNHLSRIIFKKIYFRRQKFLRSRGIAGHFMFELTKLALVELVLIWLLLSLYFLAFSNDESLLDGFHLFILHEQNVSLIDTVMDSTPVLLFSLFSIALLLVNFVVVAFSFTLEITKIWKRRGLSISQGYRTFIAGALSSIVLIIPLYFIWTRSKFTFTVIAIFAVTNLIASLWQFISLSKVKSKQESQGLRNIRVSNLFYVSGYYSFGLSILWAQQSGILKDANSGDAKIRITSAVLILVLAWLIDLLVRKPLSSVNKKVIRRFLYGDRIVNKGLIPGTNFRKQEVLYLICLLSVAFLTYKAILND